MKHMKYSIIRSLFIVPFFLLACSGNNEKSTGTQDEDWAVRVKQRNANTEKKLIGLKLSNFANHLSKDTVNVVFSYNSSDCPSCIETGLNIIGQLATAQETALYSLCTNAEGIHDRIRSFMDSTAVFHLAGIVETPPVLYSTSSPILMAVDSKSTIRKIFIPISGLDQTAEIESFITDLSKFN